MKMLDKALESYGMSTDSVAAAIACKAEGHSVYYWSNNAQTYKSAPHKGQWYSTPAKGGAKARFVIVRK